MSNDAPTPAVTVLMSVYNGIPEVDEAIQSILGQTFTDFELLVIDDGSTDGSGALLDWHAEADARLRVIHQENRGLSPSLKRGLEEARGPLVARQDADDVSEPDRLARQVAFLEAHPDVVLLGTGARILDASGRHLWNAPVETDDAVLRAMLRSTSPFYHGSTMFRREAALAAGGYRLEHHVDDILLWRGLARAGHLANLPEPLYRFRLSPSSQNNLTRPLAIQKRAILERLFDAGDGAFPPEDLEFLSSIGRHLTMRAREAQYHVNVARGLLRYADEPGRARRSAWKSITLGPFNATPWVAFALSLAPATWRARWFARRETRVARPSTHKPDTERA